MRMFCVKCGVHVTATGSECPRCHFDTLTQPGGIHPPAAPHPVPAETSECVCAECGHEQARMDPCNHCRSVRVVLISVVRNLIGPNWRSAFTEQDTVLPTTNQNDLQPGEVDR
jgi:hypothetical protein